MKAIIPENFEQITKERNPRQFKDFCLTLGIDQKSFGDQTSLAEAIRKSFFQSKNGEPPVSIEDLQKSLGLPGCPMKRTKVMEKGIPGYRYETIYGDAVFVPLSSEPTNA